MKQNVNFLEMVIKDKEMAKQAAVILIENGFLFFYTDKGLEFGATECGDNAIKIHNLMKPFNPEEVLKDYLPF